MNLEQLTINIVRYVRHLDSTSASSHNTVVQIIHIKTKVCQLVEAIMKRREDLLFRQEMKFRNKLVEYLTDWIMGNSHQFNVVVQQQQQMQQMQQQQQQLQQQQQIQQQQQQQTQQQTLSYQQSSAVGVGGVSGGALIGAGSSGAGNSSSSLQQLVQLNQLQMAAVSGGVGGVGSGVGSSGAGVDTAMSNLNRDLDQASMEATAALLAGLPLQPEENDKGDIMEAKSQLFLKYFTLFMNLLNDCSEDSQAIGYGAAAGAGGEASLPSNQCFLFV